MAQNSLVFTSEEALLQYLRDRGTDWFDQQKRIVTSDADWVYLGPTSTLNAQYFYLYVGDGSPLGQPLPKQPIPAPIVVAPIASSNSVQIAQQAADDAKLAQQAAANEAQVASAQKVVSQQEAQTATAQTRFDELNGAVNRQRGLANATALKRLNAELKLGIPSNDPLGFAMSHHDALRAKAVAKNQGAEFDQSYALLKNYDDIIKSFLADLRGAETELAGHRKVLVQAQTDLAAIRTSIAKAAPASGGSGGIPVSVSDLVK